MAIRISGNKVYNNGGDGIRIGVSDGVDVSVDNNDISGNGGQGVNVLPDLSDLYTAGLKPETPHEIIKQAHTELLQASKASPEQQAELLKGIGFSKWLNNGASLATITSLILQIFQK
ncbi:MAG: right-handed parallel beta-helix repeat-containing protein [Ewingella americana]|jgi:hypothetical protein|uniref:right-handed parallel beta-helix repeat-containing protein n=1 Tax=Ewingella americana TaxID=41202 RepID=UPI00242F5B65|nr:right-handed parallel beta-helix repeat-containing protein [Ewingella americana]MCI1676619.1 right-handed parallel beta-helix repeat-containing protein [Ewingella americana]MCI1853791.1 right-handed parallel beta-helix repeat-containing protein [Ewingella americana]MCI1859968.1 right-handed parallel beta-helix repeat-containing protein [Ewingella americana]MCI2142296.1 right-handed parallel beta-helix repeat-containing protein [Ewingella americana]MCI2163259.1 right-handed parallel beta-hel